VLGGCRALRIGSIGFRRGENIHFGLNPIAPRLLFEIGCQFQIDVPQVGDVGNGICDLHTLLALTEKQLAHKQAIGAVALAEIKRELARIGKQLAGEKRGRGRPKGGTTTAERRTGEAT